MNRTQNHLMGNGYPPNAYPYQPPMRKQMPNSPNHMYPMPPYPPQQQQRRSGGFGRNRMKQQPPMPPMIQGQSNNQLAPPQEKTGLLSKLFRNSNKRQMPPPTAQSLFSLPPNSSRGAGAGAATAAVGQAAATTAASGGVLQSLINPANLTSMLNNTQRVLQAAESVGPLVQQYAPFVKNIPSMWKLYTGMKNNDQVEPTQESKTAAVQKEAPVQKINNPRIPPKEKGSMNSNSVIHVKPHIQSRQTAPNISRRQFAKGESIPKLFF